MPKSAGGELNAINLKEVLWSTLKDVRAGKVTPAQGDVIASQAREIIRTSKVQLAVFSQANQAVSQELIDFANPSRRERK